MRKILLSLAMLTAVFSTTAQAQTPEAGLFNHLTVGLEAGTSGIGLDLATCIGPHFQVRAGYNFLPEIKIPSHVNFSFRDEEKIRQFEDLYTVSIPRKVDIDIAASIGEGKLLLDFYPVKESIFRITAGFFIGKEELVSIENTGESESIMRMIHTWNNSSYVAMNPSYRLGVTAGEYYFEPDADGIIQAQIKTSAFKPYLGIGLGKMLTKSRVGVNLDMGVKFHSTPEVYVEDRLITPEDTGDSDGGAVETISKIKVYPHIALRITGRIL